MPATIYPASTVRGACAGDRIAKGRPPKRAPLNISGPIRWAIAGFQRVAFQEELAQALREAWLPQAALAPVLQAAWVLQAVTDPLRLAPMRPEAYFPPMVPDRLSFFCTCFSQRSTCTPYSRS